MLKRIKQNEQKDCGAAAFATLLGLYGKHISLAEARDLTRSNNTGTTLQGLIEAGNKVGLETKGLEGTLEELKNSIHHNKIKTPFIALVVFKTGMSHFLVVEQWDKKGIKAFDPAKGLRKYSFDEFNEIWANCIVTFTKTNRFREEKRTISSYYLSIFFKEKHFISAIILFSIFISFFSFLGSFSYQRIIDTFILNSDSTIHKNHTHNSFLENMFHEVLYNFKYLILAIVLLYVFQTILSIIRAFFIANMSQKMNDNLFEKFINKILYMKSINLRSRDTGELITRYNITTQIQQVITQLILSIFLEIFVAITGGIILFIISKKLFLITTIILLGYILVSMIFIKPLNNINNELIEKNARTLNTLSEIFTGFETIKIFQTEKIFFNKFIKQARSFTKTGKYSVILHNIQISLIILLESLGIILVLWQGSTLVISDQLSLGALIAFISLINYYTSPVRNIINFQKDIQNVFVMIRKLNDIINDVSEKKDCLCSTEEKIESLEFKNIYFSYAADSYIIENLSVKFKSGNSYALVGESGSGKTTFMHIISSLYSPDKGTIMLNNTCLHKSKKNYRKHIAYTSNNPFLMFGTIKDNLTLGVTDFDENYFIEVLEILGINDMIKKFPNGLESVILENGENLSCGQKQRISLARALLKKPQILLLDEAFSNLDNKSKIKIFQFIESKLKSCLRIYISHDELIFSQVDQIVEFSK